MGTLSNPDGSCGIKVDSVKPGSLKIRLILKAVLIKLSPDATVSEGTGQFNVKSD